MAKWKTINLPSGNSASHGAFQTKRGMLDSMEPNNDTSATCFRNVAVHDMSFQKSICLPLTILEYPTICHSLPLFTILKYGSSCCHYWPFWMPLQLPKSRMILQFFSPVGPRVSRVCPIASPIGVGQHLWSRARRLDRCFLSSWACCIPYMMQYIYIYIYVYMHYNIIYIENYIDIFWLCARTHMYTYIYTHMITYDYIWHMYIYICIHM